MADKPARRRKPFVPVVGRAYRLRFKPGNMNNCLMHVRAIVDGECIVVCVHGKRRGWRHRIEYLRVLEQYWDRGELKLTGARFPFDE